MQVSLRDGRQQQNGAFISYVPQKGMSLGSFGKFKHGTDESPNRKREKLFYKSGISFWVGNILTLKY